ncbi:MAG: Rv3235 family protein [Actinomycetota bacterium]
MTSASLSPLTWITAPVIDYEPAPHPLGQPCPTPSGSALHRARDHARAHRSAPRETPPPKSAVTFAEAALLLVIEVIDRRRPIAQLRPLMPPALIDRVLVRARVAHTGSATLHRVRVRAVHTGADETTAAEVFASFSRSGRVHAIAARIERHRETWRMVALQIG